MKTTARLSDRHSPNLFLYISQHYINSDSDSNYDSTHDSLALKANFISISKWLPGWLPCRPASGVNNVVNWQLRCGVLVGGRTFSRGVAAGWSRCKYVYNNIAPGGN